jgi:nitrogenase molybdenum-iron protein beta chain
MFGDKIVMIGDHEEQWNTGAGEYKFYAGGTQLADAKTAINAVLLLVYKSIQRSKQLKRLKTNGNKI